MTNALAYYTTVVFIVVKSFMAQDHKEKILRKEKPWIIFTKFLTDFLRSF